MVATPADLIRNFNVTDGFIPDDILHMSPLTADQSKAVVKDRSALFVAALGPEEVVKTNADKEDVNSECEEYVIKNTFICEAKDNSESLPRRRKSFTEGEATDTIGNSLDASDSHACPSTPTFVKADLFSKAQYDAIPFTPQSLDFVPADFANWNCDCGSGWAAFPGTDMYWEYQNQPWSLQDHLDMKAAQLRAAAWQFEATAMLARAEAYRARVLCENEADTQAVEKADEKSKKIPRHLKKAETNSKETTSTSPVAGAQAFDEDKVATVPDSTWEVIA